MAVLVNSKICDNVAECGGVRSCPTGALSWNAKQRKIIIDNSKCISCGVCENECPVGAIRIASNKNELQKIQKEIDEDPRKISDLFVERYGAMSVDPEVLVDEKDFDNVIAAQTKVLMMELFSDENMECLRKSIPISEMVPGKDIVFKKIKVSDLKNIKNKYKISKLPSLLFFDGTKLMGKVEGYFGEGDIEKLKEKISKIINDCRKRKHE